MGCRHPNIFFCCYHPTLGCTCGDCCCDDAPIVPCGFTPKIVKAIQIEKNAADRGDRESSYRMGNLYQRGVVAPGDARGDQYILIKNLPLATVYFQRAIDQGCNHSRIALARILEQQKMLEDKQLLQITIQSLNR